MPDDATLLRRYADDRSEEAFAELVRRHVDGVYSAALRRVGGDTHLAEDVTQQVFVALARKAAELANHPVLTGWLYLTTRHEAANVVRGEQRRKTREQEAHAMQETLSENGSVTDWSHIAPVLDEVVDQLGPRERAAILLRFVERQTFAEIGLKLQITEDAARMRVERALEKLQTMLGRCGVTSTALALGVVLSHQAVSAAPPGLAVTACNIALAQAAALGASPVTLLSFMTTTKFSAILAVSLALLAAGAATREVLAHHRVSESLFAANRDIEALNERINELKQRAQIAEGERATIERRVEVERTAATADKARSQKIVPQANLKMNAPSNDQIAAGKAFLDRHPDLKQALTDRSRARVDARFRPLYRALNLSPVQIAQFERLLMEGEGVNMGNAGPSGPMLLRPGDGLTRAEVEQGLHDLLGDAGYQQYQEASRSIGARGLVLQVAGALYFTDTPVTAQQSENLVRIVSDAQQEAALAKRDRTEYWSLVLDRARNVLSEPQLTVLAGFQAQEQFEQELTRVRAGWQLPGWEGQTKPAK